MKITIDRADLLAALKHCAPVAGSDKPGAERPIYGHALISQADDGLRIATSDLDVAALAKAKGEADVGRWGVLVPAKRLLDVVSGLPAGEVVLTQAPGQQRKVTVRSGKSSFSLVTMDGAAAFPTLAELGARPQTEAQGWVDVEREALQEALSTTLYAAGKDETRPAMSSVHLARGQGGLVCEATDGSRLAQHEPGVAPTPGGGADLLIPAARAGHILRMLKDVEGDRLRFRVAQPWLIVQAEGHTLGVRTVDVAYPDTAQVIPTTFSWEAAINRDALAAAVRRVGHLGSDVALVVEPGAEGLRLSAVNKDGRGGLQGSCWHDLAADVTGQVPRFGLSLSYLSQAVDALRGETVRAAGNGERDAVVWRGANKARHVIMPRTAFDTADEGEPRAEAA